MSEAPRSAPKEMAVADFADEIKRLSGQADVLPDMLYLKFTTLDVLERMCDSGGTDQPASERAGSPRVNLLPAPGVLLATR